MAVLQVLASGKHAATGKATGKQMNETASAINGIQHAILIM